MTQPIANCPNCGAPVQFFWSGAIQTTCPFCKSILVRTGVDLKKVGVVADLPLDASPIQMGTQGFFERRPFVVTGRIIYDYDQGSWNEWHIVLDNGDSGWLSDAKDQFAVSFLAKNPGNIPPAGSINVGDRFMFSGAAYTVTTITRAKYRGVQGELPFEYWDKQEALFVDLLTEDGRFATIDYTEDPPLLFLGVNQEFEDLQFKNLRDFNSPAAAIGAGEGQVRVKTEGLNCPACGGPLTIRSGGQAVNVVCPQCNSILDATDPRLQVLQQFKQQTRIAPLIPLGTKGTMRGVTWEAIGFQRRTITSEGVKYSWSEYLLFDPFRGFRYLTEYNGHWNDVKEVRTLPQTGRAGRKPTAKLLGETYRHFQRAVAETTYVLGEFPWQVRVGENVEVNDYVSPPRMLSAESTGKEVTWSLGEYITGRSVWQAFKLPGHPPPAQGVYANQPSPYNVNLGGMWKVCLLLIAIAGVLTVGLFAVAARKPVFDRTYSFRAKTPGDASFVTDPFELKGHPSGVSIRTRTNLNQAWAYFNYALINEDTGQAYDFGREVSYYSGRDSDGAWTEGSANDEVIVPTVPPGTYYLRIEPEMDQGSVNYEVTVVRDVPSFTFSIIAAVLLLLPPLFYSLKSFGFEKSRWQESDYPMTSD